MKRNDIEVGEVYRYYPNGRSPGAPVRVIGFNTQYVEVRGVGPQRTPYNFALPEHIAPASKADLQEFVRRLPL